jgi:hypothetical protein
MPNKLVHLTVYPVARSSIWCEGPASANSWKPAIIQSGHLNAPTDCMNPRWAASVSGGEMNTAGKKRVSSPPVPGPYRVRKVRKVCRDLPYPARLTRRNY